MHPIEAYCQFLLAVDLGYADSVFANGCEGECLSCPAKQACTYISDMDPVDTPNDKWVDRARDFFSAVDQSLPLSYYRDNYPEYFL